jgi:hypothetical protein
MWFIPLLMQLGSMAYQGIKQDEAMKANENRNNTIDQQNRQESRRAAIAKAIGYNQSEIRNPEAPAPVQTPNLAFAQTMQGIGASLGQTPWFKQNQGYQYTPQQTSELSGMGFQYNPSSNAWTQGY